MAKFLLYAPTLLKHEGVDSDHKDDPGGLTRFGVTIATWREYGWDKDRDGDVDEADLKVITYDDAMKIYKPKYWDKLRADEINNQEVANIIFDHGVNAGISRAAKMAQAILNLYFGQNLSIDGKIGPATLKVLNSVDPGKFHDEFKKLRKDYYNYLANNLNKVRMKVIPFLKQLGIAPQEKLKKFIDGWLNRVNSFKDLIKKKSVGILTLLSLTFLGIYIYNRE